MPDPCPTPAQALRALLDGIVAAQSYTDLEGGPVVTAYRVLGLPLPAEVAAWVQDGVEGVDA